MSYAVLGDPGCPDGYMGTPPYCFAVPIMPSTLPGLPGQTVPGVPEAPTGVPTPQQGCPGMWYLIDRNDQPYCSPVCPPGWHQETDVETNAKLCVEPLGPDDPVQQDEAARCSAAGGVWNNEMRACVMQQGVPAAITAPETKKETPIWVYVLGGVGALAVVAIAMKI